MTIGYRVAIDWAIEYLSGGSLSKQKRLAAIKALQFYRDALRKAGTNYSRKRRSEAGKLLREIQDA